MTDSSKIISNSADADSSMFKIAVLAILSIGFLFSFGFFLKLFFQDGGVKFLFIAGLAAVLFLIIFLLQSLFVKSFKVNILMIFLSCVGLAAAFYDKIAEPTLLIGVGLVFLTLMLGNFNGVRELKNSLTVNFWKISKIVLSKAVAAIFLFASIVYIYGGLAANKDFFISENSFETVILLPAAIAAQKFYPEINPSLTINELAVNLAKKQIEEAPELKILPAAEKKMIINQAAAEFENKIFGFLGISKSIGGKSTISELIYKIMKDKFNSLPENFQSIILIGVVLTIFLTLEILAFPTRLIISFIAFIIYEILLAVDFAVIELEGKSKEILVLK